MRRAKQSDAGAPAGEPTYSLGAAARLTGLSPAVLRAWERRYGVVEPVRTAGGTRRYRAADLERIRQVKAAVDAGHRVGRVAALPDAELRALSADPEARPDDRVSEILAALERLESGEAQRALSQQLAVLGPARFSREVVCPLLREIGALWANGELDIATEHLATSVLRSMLGASLQPTAFSLLGPTLVFATLPGERHELGLQMAAVTALGAGANPIFLGCEVPAPDLCDAARRAKAEAVVLSFVVSPADEIRGAVAPLASSLPDDVRLWFGGGACSGLAAPARAERIDSLEAFEGRVQRLAVARSGRI